MLKLEFDGATGPLAFNEPAAFPGDPMYTVGGQASNDSMYMVGERVYGGWWIGEERAKLGDVDKNAAANLLIHLKEEGES